MGKTKRSSVWNYFVATGDVNRNISTCSLCKRKVRAGDSSTSNLFNHLHIHHRPQYLLVKPSTVCPATNKSQASSTSTSNPLSDAFQRAVPYDPHGQKSRTLTEAVTYCIAKDAMPFSTVEREGFRNMLKAFDSRYQPPSKSQMTKVHIPKLYDITSNRVRDELKDIGFFSATTDMWSSHGMTPYLGYTVHHIDHEWNLKNHTLGTRFVPQDHNADILGIAMKELLKDWYLDPQNQVCVTTDNGANILKAIKDLEWQHLSCFGHNLHLGITKFIDNDHHLKRSLGVAHGIVAQFNYSWKKRRDLTVFQVKENKTPKALISVTI